MKRQGQRLRDGTKLVQGNISFGGDQQDGDRNQEDSVSDHEPGSGAPDPVAGLRKRPIGCQEHNEGRPRSDPGHGEQGHRPGAYHQHGETGEQVGCDDKPYLSKITAEVANREDLDQRAESQHQHGQDQRQGIQVHGGGPEHHLLTPVRRGNRCDSDHDSRDEPDPDHGRRQAGSPVSAHPRPTEERGAEPRDPRRQGHTTHNKPIRHQHLSKHDLQNRKNIAHV